MGSKYQRKKFVLINRKVHIERKNLCASITGKLATAKKKLNNFEKQAHYCCAHRQCVVGENNKGLACSDLDFSQN